MTDKRKSLVHKPSVINTIETNITKHFSWHPNVLSSIKLFILTPIFGYILFHSEEFTQVKPLLIGLFLLFLPSQDSSTSHSTKMMQTLPTSQVYLVPQEGL